MSAVHQLSRADARRIAVQAQLVGAERPAGLLELVRHLGLLQLDPIAAVAPSADLVAWSRLGSSYSPAELRDALENRTLVELQAMIRAAEDIALYRPTWRVGPDGVSCATGRRTCATGLRPTTRAGWTSSRGWKARGRWRCASCRTRT